MNNSSVLVVPRKIFDDYFSLLAWSDIQDKIDVIEGSFSWLQRADAEHSTDWVQPIPCAFIRDSHGRFCTLRRVKHETRDDLTRKASLIVGGHLEESDGHATFREMLLANLLRELDEEVGIADAQPTPVGVIVDNSSILASRHIAFVHEVTASQIYPRAPEEFSNRSSLTGQFLSASQLVQLRGELDPWSKLLFEEFIRPSGLHPEPRQRSFLDYQYDPIP